MPLPLREQITQAILETMADVTVANGFNVNAQAVRWDRLGKDPPAPNLAVLVEGKANENAPPTLAIDWRQEYAILCYAVEPEASTNSTRTDLQVLRADLTKALMADIT